MAAEDGSVVLRIKRKRNEDPLDALLVAQVFKKPHIAKSEDCVKEAANLKENDLTSTVERVFKFVGSVPQGDDTKRKDLLAKIQKQSANHENLAKSRIHDQKNIQERLRKQKKLLNQEARLKVISSNREIETDSCQSDRLSTEACNTDAASEEVVDDVDLEVQRLLSVYDVVKDEESNNSDSKRQKRNARKAQAKDMNVLMCNSVKMIREKLTVSDESKTEERKTDKEGYVYDFYYPSDNYGRLGDIVEVLPFDSDLVHERLEEDFGDIYDDEDDSNDEGNWRNDYPDEDDWSDSSQDRRYYEDYGFDSDEGYRRYAFDDNLSEDED